MQLFFKINLIFLTGLSLYTTSINANTIIDPDNYQAITSDLRAFRVGEPIVILVVEQTQAASSAGTGTRKKLEFEANAFDTLGNKSVGVGLMGAGEGNGQTVRQGSATTQLSAVITEILPNNMVRISGEQNLVVNNENQKVILSGIARYLDISKDNTLMSNRLANANIEIQGVGDISNAQKQGIISRVFSWLGLI